MACKKGGRESLYTGETARGAYNHVGVKLGPRDFSMKVTGRFTSSLFCHISEATQIADQAYQRNQELRGGRSGRNVMNLAREFKQLDIILAWHLKTFHY